jgi:hypothetical protein
MLQGLPSSVQLVPLATFASLGQAAELPVQLSATSHSPADSRHTVADDLYASTHVSALPEQWSAASSSHASPCDVPVQLVAAGWNASAGHAAAVPVQLSATSQTPAAERQTTVLGLNP